MVPISRSSADEHTMSNEDIEQLLSICERQMQQKAIEKEQMERDIKALELEKSY
ncbi:hypothetical protein BC833DRAFT_598182, partial [Globomyces pollinis-pini]